MLYIHTSLITQKARNGPVLAGQDEAAAEMGRREVRLSYTQLSIPPVAVACH